MLRTFTFGLLILSSLGFARDEGNIVTLKNLMIKEGFEEALEYAMDTRDRNRREEMFLWLAKNAKTDNQLEELVEESDALRNGRTRAALMILVLDNPAAGDDTVETILSDMDELSSGHLSREVMVKVMQHNSQPAPDDLFEALEELHGGFRADVVRQVIARYDGGLLVREDIVDALEEIPHEPQRFELLSQLVNKGDLERKHFKELLGDLDDLLQSPTLKSSFLTRVSEVAGDDKKIVKMILDCAGHIDNPHQRAGVLTHTITNAPSDAVEVSLVLEACDDIKVESVNAELMATLMEVRPEMESISIVVERLTDFVQSDYNRGRLLERALELGQLTPAFFESLDEIESEHERGQLLHAILEADLLRPQNMERYLDSTAGISSEHVKYKVLKHLVSEQEIPAELEWTFQEVVDSLGSKHYRQKILRAMEE